MKFIALEVWINGNRQFTVGVEDWQTIHATILGHNIDPARMTSHEFADPKYAPESRTTSINFFASVSVPTTEEDHFVDPDGRTYNSSRTGSYKGAVLQPGDILEIRVIETDKADEPTWQENDPSWSLGPVARPSSDPE